MPCQFTVTVTVTEYLFCVIHTCPGLGSRRRLGKPLLALIRGAGTQFGTESTRLCVTVLCVLLRRGFIFRDRGPLHRLGVEVSPSLLPFDLN
jgi:hypothetical protein